MLDNIKLIQIAFSCITLSSAIFSTEPAIFLSRQEKVGQAGMPQKGESEAVPCCMIPLGAGNAAVSNRIVEMMDKE